ncbi:MAG: hypothetical protein DRR42_26375 [Gammaproteobacteria bacterium]|nr:MAG: hypothetical protein DRR42_26375 [Gammaproteobacteria bacterium]
MDQLAVTLIVIFLPGLIAATISDKLTVHSKWSSFKFSLYAFLLGISSYALLQIGLYAKIGFSAFHFDGISWRHLDVWRYLLDGKSEMVVSEIVLAVAFSIPVALLASWTVNFKLFNKLGQKLRVTTKYGDENLFSYYLNAEEIDWIYVRDKTNGLTYQGRVVSHSENELIQEVVLAEVSVYRYDDSALLYSIPTIYLTRGMGEFVIEAIPPEIMG